MILDFLLLFGIIISPLFVGGIGLDRLFSVSLSPQRIVRSLFPDVVLMLAVSTVMWFFMRYALRPIHLLFLMPLFFVLLFSVLEELYAFFFKSSESEGASLQEKGFSYGLSFYALYTATSYIELLGIISVSVIAFVLFAFIFFSIRQRIDNSNAAYEFKIAPLLLISLGCIALVLYAIDFSWLL